MTNLLATKKISNPIKNKSLPSSVAGLIGITITVLIWWLLATTVFADVGRRPDGSGGAIPTPLAVLEKIFSDGFDFYFKNASVTLLEATIGFLWGNLLALMLTSVVIILPKLENLSTQIAVITYCIPVVAIGPIVRLIVGAPESGDPAGAAIVLAALSVFFTTVVGTLSGIKSADRASLEIVSAYGGGRLQQLLKVQIISAIPAVLAALRIAAPAAFLGAILGEYVGGPDVGFGPAMVNAQQSLEVARVWGVALVSGLIAGAAYAFFGLLSKLLTPWASGSKATSR